MLTKQEVTVIQSALREAGFLYKEPDGVWDLHTMQGYRNYLAVKLCAPNSQYISQPTSMDLVPDVLKGGVVSDNSVGGGNNEPNGNEPPAPETTEPPQVGQQPDVQQPTVPEQPTESNNPEVEQPEVENPTEIPDPETPEQPEVEQPESEEPEQPAGKSNKTKRSK